ncbi:hypothetical protein [Kangiella shandongensis]|uniref:hypothetical protein n=1 Tax=Kangiella shandongensis TaxID=2763258 RepID=UPI001CBD4BDB|nr:hypothetical protein [Kangiella shandongensis]
MNIEIGTIDLGAVGFKAAKYREWDANTYMQGATNDSDWAGLYIANNEAVCCGYLPDYADRSGNGTGYIHKVRLAQDMPIISCFDESFKRGNVDIPALKKALRDKGVTVQNTDYLMPKLGQLGYVFRCYNNEDSEIELIIPNLLADTVEMEAVQECAIKSYEVQRCVSL